MKLKIEEKEVFLDLGTDKNSHDALAHMLHFKTGLCAPTRF